MDHYLGAYYVFGEKEKLEEILVNVWDDSRGLDLSEDIEQSVNIFPNVLVFRHNFTTSILLDKYVKLLRLSGVSLYSMTTSEDGPGYMFNFFSRNVDLGISFVGDDDLDKFKQLDLSSMGVINTNKDFIFNKNDKYIIETKKNILMQESEKEIVLFESIYHSGLLKDGEDW